MKANAGWQDKEISQALDVSIPTIEQVRKRFVFEGFEASLKPCRPQWQYSRKLDGEQEARMVALVCIDSISHETVRQGLDDNELKPWRSEE